MQWPKKKKKMLISYLFCFPRATKDGFTLLHLKMFIAGSPFQLQIKQRFDFIFGVLTPLSTISWRPVLVVEEAGVPGENHHPWASNW